MLVRVSSPTLTVHKLFSAVKEASKHFLWQKTTYTRKASDVFMGGIIQCACAMREQYYYEPLPST